MPDRPLRLLVVTTSAPPVSRVPELFHRLLDAGIELVFALPGDGVPQALLDRGGARTVELPLERTGAGGYAVTVFRAAADLVRFLHPDLERARWPRLRAIRRILKLTRHRGATEHAREWSHLQLPRDVSARLGEALCAVERLLPPEPELEGAIGHVRPDAILLVSRCVLGGVDPDVIKVARRLGVPSIVLVWSWDNLSSKAALNEHPDHLLVWNELQAREAVELQGVARERVHVVGAVNFDRSFGELESEVEPMLPSAPEGTRTILYLGSSPNVVPHERAVFERWLTAVRASTDPVVRDARIVVRPHPSAARKWEGWQPPDGVVLAEPRAKSEPVRLSHLLRRVDATVALNTSVEIEAAIAGCPVVTFRAGPEAPGQEGLVHFYYLLEEQGGFVVDASDLDEHTAKLGRVLRGEYDAETMREFAERFVRPAGVSHPVVPLVASAVLEAAGADVHRPAVTQPNLSALASRSDGSGGPRLLVVGTPLLVKRLPDLLHALLDAGAELVFTVPRDALPPALAAHPAASSVALPLERSRPGADGIRLFRAAGDLVRFLGPDFEEARWPRRRALDRLLRLAGLPRTRALRDAGEALRLPRETCTLLGSSFRECERLLPPEPELAAAVAGIGADAMLVLTRCALGGAEPDALKAARSAGLPSIMLVCSWDNLSAKATLNEHPDRLLVWNDVQAREAVELQGVPRDRVLVLGAPNFDGFFDELGGDVSGARAPRDGRPALLYLGSSPKVAPHEPAIFERWLAAVRSSGDPDLREATVVVRPHPAAARRWQEWTPPDDGVTLVAPQARIEPARLSELLLDADAVIALNTSAEIEAAIAERPVLTFRAGRKARGQEGTLHFSYLLEAKGGFVLDAATLEEHISRLEAVLRDGYDREPLRRFVERFVRPAGLARPVVPLVAGAILDFALAEGGEPHDALRAEGGGYDIAREHAELDVGA